MTRNYIWTYCVHLDIQRRIRCDAEKEIELDVRYVYSIYL